jgi:UDP:flavonoid glycosyltransferase YjiC (YdhE family)
MGSLGDLHPMIALAIELREREHVPVINTWEGYRDKIVDLGIEFLPLRPNLEQDDPDLLRRVMDARTGPEVIIRELIFPNLRETYDDLTVACDGADLLINGEVVYVAGSVAEKTGIKWITTSLAPLSMFSSYDPNVYPTAQWLEYLRPMPVVFHQALFGFLKWTINDWFEPFNEFRRGLGLSDDLDPVFMDKYSSLLHLALFSKALGMPQPDWFSPTLQTGFCFYDESESTEIEPRLDEFLKEGEPPIVFTLGSAAVMDARDFFEESAKAAKLLGRRAILLYGRDREPPAGLDDDIVGFEFAPYSLVFPRAACVVHQAGVGTTAQVLRAGVPQLIMPFSHDQPDNAARCRRAGVAEIIDRDSYSAKTAAKALVGILNDRRYRENALPLKQIIEAEHGTKTACDAIEAVLRK